MDINKKIRDIIEKPLKEIDIFVDNVEYIKENNNYFLRITIDKKPIVDLDTCVEASSLINPLIDEADPIAGAYILEISSKERGDIK